MTINLQPVAQAGTPLAAASVTVHKFGGTSVGGPSQFAQVGEIVKRLLLANNEKPVVVLSAMSGTTNRLYASIHAAVEGVGFDKPLSEIREGHLSCISKLHEDYVLSKEALVDLTAVITDDLKGISKNLTHIAAAKHCPELMSDVIAGYGELWSNQILAALLTCSGVASTWINARDFLYLSRLSGKDARVDWKRSHAPIVPAGIEVAVITGFLATSAGGVPTTLKRNGSDHSGAIVANLVDAEMLTIWTDVDGIYSADPRVVKEAIMIPSMSYKETAELAYFGAKVIHPQTIAPCVGKKIPVVLRNTFNLACSGTLISASPDIEARAVTIIPEVALINVEGSGLFGFIGIAAKLFSAVAGAESNVIMITQASSEYSICFAVPVGDAEICGDAVRLTFAEEIEEHSIDVSVDTSAAIVAAVGDGMSRQLGMLGKLATALGEAGVNIRALAQGSSERNITFVVNKEDGGKALSSLHRALI
jgi:aspartokinase/homoserine dehydrogenase 1